MRRRWVSGAIVGAGLCLAASPARAADPVLRLELSPAETVPGQPVQATVTVTGGAGFRVSLDPPPGVTMRAAGSSRNVQIVNGAIESSHQNFFQIAAEAPGTYRIGPARAVRGGRTVTSNEALLTVAPAAEPPRGSAAVYAQAEVDTPRPYLGQQVVYTLRLFRPRTQTLRNFRLEEPDTDGLWREPIDADADRATIVKGEPYLVHTITRAYFPTRVGQVDISPAGITYEQVLPRRRRRPRSVFDDSFFDLLTPATAPRRIDAPAVRLEVQPLPAPPPGTDPAQAVVGLFSLTSSLSADTAVTGESLTLTVRLTGQGNLRAVPDIHIPASEAYKAYPDVAAVTVSPAGPVVGGVREQRIAFVPQRAGEMTIPPLSLITFDPVRAEWKTLRTPAYTVHVDPGDSQVPVVVAAPAPPGATPTPGPPTRLAAGLLAPRPLPARLGFAGQGERIAATATAGGAPLVFLVSWALRRRAAAHTADPTLDRRRRAGKTARAALRRMPQNAEAVATILANYVADRVGAPPGSITGDEAITIIREADGEAAAAASTTIRAGEAARYGGATSPAGGTRAASTLITTLDRLDLHRRPTHA